MKKAILESSEDGELFLDMLEAPGRFVVEWDGEWNQSVIDALAQEIRSVTIIRAKRLIGDVIYRLAVLAGLAYIAWRLS